MFIVERLIAAVAIGAAAHFSMGFINTSAGGSGGALLFPFPTNSASHWVFGSLDRGMLALLIPVMIGLAGIAVLGSSSPFSRHSGCGCRLLVAAAHSRRGDLLGDHLDPSPERLDRHPDWTRRRPPVGRMDIGMDARSSALTQIHLLSTHRRRSDMRVLVTAASRHNGTTEVAQAIASTLERAGLEVTRRRPDEVVDLAGYDAVVIGSAIYAGHWLKPAKDLIGRTVSRMWMIPLWLSTGPIGDPLKPD